MKKVYKNKGVGPLASSQERRTPTGSPINRSSTSRQPLAVFFDPVYIGSSLFVIVKKRPARRSSVPWKARWTVFSCAHRPAAVNTRSPLQDSRLFGKRPWKILAATYETNGFLSNPDIGENLVSRNLIMETGCNAHPLAAIPSRRAAPSRVPIQPRLCT